MKVLLLILTEKFKMKCYMFVVKSLFKKLTAAECMDKEFSNGLWKSDGKKETNTLLSWLMVFGYLN